ncbi:ATP-binding protein [Paraburkholderia tagetis]|uniref:histidine kinase n=1 Tax=Paraburkholderia tagetis TaxID=2913261 RepID=A0A9X1RW11_9BURK|nr:ATP-binding protein [Paraburkholderia tagetis]MCG5075378.1 ATP-binding protein [Paraburkholderia tagetis]
MNRDSPDVVTADAVLVTEDLSRRPIAMRNYQAECAALSGLGKQMAVNARRVPQTVAELALDRCRADSAGVTMIEPRMTGERGEKGERGERGERGGRGGRDEAESVLRLVAIAGPLASCAGRGARLDETPCGTAIERNTVLLVREPARYFAALRRVEPQIHEALIVPCAIDGEIVGAVWAATHTYDKRFDAQDARFLGDLGAFVAAAQRMTGALEQVNLTHQTDRRKDEFLVTLAHELRNPLASISNVAQLLLRNNAAAPAPEGIAEILNRQVHQVTRLVDDLLDLSRIAQGKLEFDMRPTALADAVRSAVESCRPYFDENRQTLTVSLPEAPVMLTADSVRLTQIIANLLHNAAKYSEPGAQAWLTVTRDGSDQVLISVRDSGAGIPKEQLGHVFEMFVQAHRDTARGKRGLGIGLMMVKQLVEHHGGRVEARSAGPGLGSEFVVSLPER